jgi:hypothetical protein
VNTQLQEVAPAMPDENPMIHVRLPRSLVKRVSLVGAYMEKDRAHTVEALLEIALNCLEHHPRASEGPELAKLVAIVGNR